MPDPLRPPLDLMAPVLENDPSLLVPALAATSLLLAILCAIVRASLSMAVGKRILQRVADESRHKTLAPLLGRVDAFASSAAIMVEIFQALFTLLVFKSLANWAGLTQETMLLAVLISAAGMILSSEVLPTALARAGGDALLLRLLPTFAILQTPVMPLRALVDAARRAVLRVLRLPDEEPATRRLLAGLRGALEEAEPNRDLDEQEREMIENVIEFRGVDAVEVMTPRTEVTAVDVEDGVVGALRLAMESGCSRLPVFEDTIDTIIGTVSALDLTRSREAETGAETNLRNLLKPPFLVPETKLLAELLKELRHRKEKMAVVVDEYGGTAGILTVTDILRELVGEIPEVDAEIEGIQTLDGGSFEVPAALHVTEVNEALEIDLPEEEDFETLAGFVLARLGHLPKEGESFEENNLAFHILKASDRRVLRVLIQRPA
ncbi:MAG TPA: HlyC/CorC family transporter [Planctomycetes bacterium]|nr:HlyC/CorC family transporter [Planctomycetota bacterium]HIL38226.1 HlyC/CorC family transporter [Planctomycetota bacterium]